MIRVTKLDGTTFHLNPELIEALYETTDTHIMLSNGNSYIVREPAAVVIRRIIEFRARILRLSFLKESGRGGSTISSHKGR